MSDRTPKSEITTGALNAEFRYLIGPNYCLHALLFIRPPTLTYCGRWGARRLGGSYQVDAANCCRTCLRARLRRSRNLISQLESPK